MTRSRRNRVHLVTQARTPKSQDIGQRERRYLIMMAVRVGCFLVAIVMVSKGAGWLAAFPAVGAIAIPYFAVVFANGGREPNDTRGFQEYQPNLPEPHPSPAASGQVHLRDPGIGAQPGAAGERAAGNPAATAAPAPPADIRTAATPGGAPEPGPVPTGAAGRQGPSARVQSGPEKRHGNG